MPCIIYAYNQVYIGENLNYTEGHIQYQQPQEDDKAASLPIYIPAAVGAVILIIIVLFLLILCIVIQRYRKKEKESEKLFADLQLQLEEMESGLADECKTGTTYILFIAQLIIANILYILIR